MDANIRRELKNKPMNQNDHMTRKATSRMVEGHLQKQRSAYDAWIADLCRDAEESALERDRLKAKLAALRDDHKRKIMAQVIGRLSNMTYFVYWKHWYNTTVKEYAQKIEVKIREAKRQLKAYQEETAVLEADAQRRANEAAKLAMDGATDSQKALIKKILTKLCTLKLRLFWGQWFKQAFYHKYSQRLMAKIIKRLYNSALAAGFTRWMDISRKWHLVVQIELKESLLKELAELEKLSKQYREDAEKRQNEAAAMALSRASGTQKDLMVKILSKLTGNLAVMSFKIWKRKADESPAAFGAAQKLMTKVMMRLINIKKFTAFRHWHRIVFSSGLEKTALREALLKSQVENLAETLKRRAEQLKALRGEAAEMLSMSHSAQKEVTGLLKDSDAFNLHLYTILDKGYVEKQAKLKAQESARALREGDAERPVPPMGGVGDQRRVAPPGAPPGAPPSAPFAPFAPPAGGYGAPATAQSYSYGGAAPSYGGAAPSYGGGAPSYGAAQSYGAAPAGSRYGAEAAKSSKFSPPPRQSKPKPKGGYATPKPKAKADVGDLGPNVKAELIAFVFDLQKKGLVTLPKEGGSPKSPGGIDSPVQRHIRGRETWENPKESYLVPELEKMVAEDLGGLPGSVAQSLKQRGEKVLKPLAMAGDSRLWAAKQAYEASLQLSDLWETLDSLGALPPLPKD